MIATTSEAACRDCKKPFQRRSTLQSTCIPCVIKVANAKDRATAKAQRQAVIDARKADAADTRARRVALKSRRDWMDEAQKAVNAYVRARDRGIDCVSCNKPWEDTFQAGHWLSRGARPELRFDLNNIHGQCVRCNMHLHGNPISYRYFLIQRIGLVAVEALEGPHPPAKWSVDELKAIRDGYRLLTKQLLEQITSAQTETLELCPAPELPASASTASPAIDALDHPRPVDASPLR